MAIFELKPNGIVPANLTTFGTEGIKERADLQRLLRSQIDVVSPKTMIIAEEFGQWEDSKRRIDLLGLDDQANLVVIELKRTDDGSHMELQALRYAAMVSTMTFDQAVKIHESYLKENGKGVDARQAILDFLGWDDSHDDQFADDVRIVLVAADFSPEITTTAMWLYDHDLDIRCVRIKPYKLEDHLVVDVQQIIPLPEAADYQIKIREKMQKERKAKQSNIDFTRYDVCIKGQPHPNLWKRRAILLVAKTLVEAGTPPEDIAALIEWRSNRMWWRVEGQVGSEAFVERARQQGQSQGRAFVPKRWFCEADDLVQWNGATYAFSNQWGNRWAQAMNLLAQKYPQFEIAYKATNGDSEGDDTQDEAE
jgi:hypothetical protein